MKPLFLNVDCASFYVDDLDAGIRFYSDALGLRLLWRTKGSCGLGLAEGSVELVLVDQHNPMVDFLVERVEDALEVFTAAGGALVYGPFDIDIGRCAVVEDCWHNRFCVLDTSKGLYQTDSDGNVTGVG